MSAPSGKPEVFFHVGLGKTASTYLQHKVFPHFQGIHYIPTNRYKKSIELIEKQEYKSYLVSREFDRQFEREVSHFARFYPDAHLIIVLRRHDKWIASQYRRHVKNGFYLDFKDFIDVKNNGGFWDRKELSFMDKLRLIEKYSSQKPLILFHDEIRENPLNFIDRIAAYTRSTYNPKDVSLKPMHASYSEKQLKAIKLFCRKFVKIRPEGRRNRLMNWLLFRPWWLLFHLVMYVAAILPGSWFGRKPLIEPHDLDEVRKAMEDDWSAVIAYAEKLQNSSARPEKH